MSANLMSLARSGGKFLKLFGDRKMVRTLPYDAEVDYLDGTGTQYSDTYFKGSDVLDFEIDALVSSGGDRTFFGARYTWGGDHSRIYTLVARSYGRFAFGLNGAWNKCPELGIVEGNRFWAKKTGNTVIMSNGVSIEVNSEKFETPYEIELFAMSTVTQKRHGQEPLIGRIYSVSFSTYGTNIGDFIPVRFTNELGETEGAMFDRVSGQLFRNAGTGAFIIGPDKTI